MGMFDDIVNEPRPAARRGIFDDIINEPVPANGILDKANDIGASVATGLGRGVAALAGIPRGIKDLGQLAIDLPFQVAEQFRALPDKSRERAEADRRRLDLPTASQVIGAAEQVIPSLGYEPKTIAGRYAQTISELAPGAMLGPGGTAGNLARFAAAPGVVTQLARDAGLPGPIPEILGAATGAGAAFSGRGGNVQAERAVSRAARGMTPQQIDATETLLRDAQSIGLPLTRAEAAQHVTGGATRLADLQRVVEGQGGLREFMAPRPAQVEQAGRALADQIAPIPANPSMVGPQVAESADDIIRARQAAINRATRPLYQQAEQARVGQQAAQALAADPIYAQTLQAIRDDPVLNRTIANLPNDSPAVLDLVQRRLREQAENARIPGQANTSNLAAANYEATRQAPIQAAEQASPAYQVARATQEQLRRDYLEPLLAGPIGKLAEKPETQNAINALFPRNPVPNSEGEVLGAVRRLSGRNPWAARQLVRAHVESVFNQATRDLQSGPTQFGGASFAAQLRGNFQQDANMLAAIRGLPHGEDILAGFDRVMQVMTATGQRQRIGSQTAFNQELQAQLKSGGAATEAGVMAAGVGMKLPSRIYEAFQRWNLGRNTDEIARLLTDPAAGDAFRRLAGARRGTNAEIGALSRIVNIASQKQAERQEKPRRQ